MKRRFDAGAKFAHIATALSIGRVAVAGAFKRWHELHGLRAPDGRTLPGRLEKVTIPNSLQPRFMELWDANLAIEEIARQLGCSRDVVRAAVKQWYVDRGLPEPDGRRRRLEIEQQLRDLGNA